MAIDRRVTKGTIYHVLIHWKITKLYWTQTAHHRYFRTMFTNSQCVTAANFQCL